MLTLSPRLALAGVFMPGGCANSEGAALENNLGSGPGALTAMPPEDQGAGDVDAGVSAGDDADQEGKGKIVNCASAKDEQRQGGQEERARSNNRPAQRLVGRLVVHFLESTTQSALKVFADSIKSR